MLHDFRERLTFSQGVELSDDVLQRVALMVPNATGVVRASEADDRQGTDYWIQRSHDLPALSIDVKHREFCPIQRFGTDDACIETTSVYRDGRRIRPGWTLDYRKRTDFVVYTWPAEGGTRFWVVPFPPLCAASRRNWRAWAVTYKEREAQNNGYVTLSVYPPRNVIAKAMRDFLQGVASNQEAA